MQKVKSNASWNELSPEQLEKLDQWLFEEKLGYAEVFPKAQTELGFSGSISSLRRYGIRRQQAELLTDFKEAVTDAVELQAIGTEPDAARKAGMMVMGAHLFRMLRAAPEKVKEWAPVASLLVQNDHNEALRELKGEEHKIRREAMAFAKEKYEFDVMEKALAALPQLRELAEARRDPAAKEYEEKRHWNRVRRSMFGGGRDVHPESAEEEAEMMAAKKAREARREHESRMERERERIKGAQTPVPSSPSFPEYVGRVTKWEEENWKMGAEYEI